MSSTTVSVRIDPMIKKRLKKLAKSTGRSRSFLAAEATSGRLPAFKKPSARLTRAGASLTGRSKTGSIHGTVKKATEAKTPNDMNIEWSPEAIEDLSSLRAYIAQDDPSAVRAV